jgi:predicted RNase H-like nuclease (RuvC/YqgF family)
MDKYDIVTKELKMVDTEIESLKIELKQNEDMIQWLKAKLRICFYLMVTVFVLLCFEVFNG